MDHQKAANNALEMLQTGTFRLTGWDVENIYPRVKMLLFGISNGDIVCLDSAEYQRLKALDKPKRKRSGSR